MSAVLKKGGGYMGDNTSLPVASVEAAVPFYESVLGFRVRSRSDAPHKAAILERDGVQMGLAENGGDPTQDGSWFHVHGIEALLAEFRQGGLKSGLKKGIGDLAIEKRDDGSWKVFYVVAPDGLCFWFGERQTL